MTVASEVDLEGQVYRSELSVDADVSAPGATRVLDIFRDVALE
jgi:hypothetical protein